MNLPLRPEDAPSSSRPPPAPFEIDASADDVWRQIERVPAIRPEEHDFTWSHAIGFPRPVEATLLGTGVGAVQEAILRIVKRRCERR